MTQLTGSKPTSRVGRRQARILDLLMDGNPVQIKDLADSLGVSLMTIHRDLSDLKASGVIRQVRGSVSAEKSVLFESSYLYRSQKQREEKQRLAHAAIAHLEPGNAVVWDDSTTTYHLCDYINRVTPITVISNALPVLQRLSSEPDVDVIAIGGAYHRGYNGFFGLSCEKTITSYHVDVALLSSTTVQGLALYTQDEQIVRAKQAMMSIAKKSILLVDSSKFHFTALNYVADLSQFDTVIVAGELEKTTINELIRSGINLELV